jgi:hypothetical protein
MIEAPKASVELASLVCSSEDSKENDGDEQRGLFATDIIYPGERILAIPAQSLIEDNILRQIGRYELDEATALSSSPSCPLPVALLERRIIALIEDLRTTLCPSESSQEPEPEKPLHQWRDDDTIALYLAWCRNLVKTIQSSLDATGERELESLATDDGTPVDVQAEALPVDSRRSFPSFLPHIALLPSSFPTSPLYFLPEELERLEGTNCHGYATRLRSQMESDYGSLRNSLERYYSYQQDSDASHRTRLLSSSFCGFCETCRRQSGQEGSKPRCDSMRLDKLSFESYKWALCCVYSRSTDFETETGNKRRVIAPLFDMMNHDFSSHVTHSLDPDGTLSVFNGSSHSIQPGEEICLSYGKFSNEKFLLIYGFVVPDNPFDAVAIYSPLSSSDPLYSAKVRILHRCGIADTNEPHYLFAIKRNQGHILPELLLSVLRVTGIQSAEELLAVATGIQDGETLPMVSHANEEAALTALQQALYTMSRQLALNMISDESLQGGSSQPSSAHESNRSSSDSSHHKGETTESEDRSSAHEINLRNAKLLCQSEYQILQAALMELSERLAALEGGASGPQQ